MKAALALIAALPLSAMADTNFDFDPPSWRGGQYSIQVGWEWPSAPESYWNMPPTMLAAVDGQTPGTLEGAPGRGWVTNGPDWQWIANDGEPGLYYKAAKSAIAYFQFPHWERGLGPEPSLFRVQVTYVAPYPAICAITPSDDQATGWSNLQYMVVDQTITNWERDYVGISMFPEGMTLRAVRIDLITIPSPGAIVAIGCLGFMGRDRRHSRSA